MVRRYGSVLNPLWKINLKDIDLSPSVFSLMYPLISINNDLSFTILDASYYSGPFLGTFILDAIFKFVEVKGEFIYWEVINVTVK